MFSLIIRHTFTFELTRETYLKWMVACVSWPSFTASWFNISWKSTEVKTLCVCEHFSLPHIFLNYSNKKKKTRITEICSKSMKPLSLHVVNFTTWFRTVSSMKEKITVLQICACFPQTQWCSGRRLRSRGRRRAFPHSVWRSRTDNQPFVFRDDSTKKKTTTSVCA